MIWGLPFVEHKRKTKIVFYLFVVVSQNAWPIHFFLSFFLNDISFDFSIPLPYLIYYSFATTNRAAIDWKNKKNEHFQSFCISSYEMHCYWFGSPRLELLSIYVLHSEKCSIFISRKKMRTLFRSTLTILLSFCEINENHNSLYSTCASRHLFSPSSSSFFLASAAVCI